MYLPLNHVLYSPPPPPPHTPTESWGTYYMLVPRHMNTPVSRVLVTIDNELHTHKNNFLFLGFLGKIFQRLLPFEWGGGGGGEMGTGT